MILNPKRDTITICLPTDWVGKPIVCIIKSPYELEEEEMVSVVSEAALCYHVRKRKYRKPTPLRRKRRPKQRRRRR